MMMEIITFILLGGHGRRNVSADLQMVAAYAAQVAHDGQHIQSNHSPEQYRQVTSNGNSVMITFPYILLIPVIIIIIILLFRYHQL